MRILVVGGAGYVGSTTVEHFVDAGHEVTVYDDLSTGHLSAVVRPARLVRGSGLSCRPRSSASSRSSVAGPSA